MTVIHSSSFMKLAIIKDDDAIRYVVDLARDAGFAPEDTLTARNQTEAMALIERLIPDIAVVDPHLSDDERLEDGIEVIDALRQRSETCIIICLTGSGTTNLGVRALKAGAQDHVDMSWPHVNWCVLLREKLKIWKAVSLSRAEHQ